MQRSKRIWLLLSMVFLLLFTGCDNKTEKKKQNKETNLSYEEQLEADVLNHLKEKYNEEFEIKKTRYIQNIKSYEFTVYPVANSKLDFIVRDFGQPKGKFSDSYERLKWSLESKELIRLFVEKIHSKYAFSARVEPALYDWNADYESFSTFIDETKEIEREYRSSIYIFRDITEENKEEILQSVYDLIEFLKSKGFKSADVEISFFDEEYFKDKDVHEMMDFTAGFSTFSHNYSNFLNYRIFIKPEIQLNFKPPYIIFNEIKSSENIGNGLSEHKRVSKIRIQNPKKPYKE